MDILGVLDVVGQELDKLGVRWAVAGGLALQAYGWSRVTQDIDLVVEATARAGVVARMEELGYETLYASEGFSNHLHSVKSRGRVDCIYVEAPTADQLFADCRRLDWSGGRTMKVPSPEHLVAMKVHAIRNDASRMFRELADIDYLMRLPGVDGERLRDYFRSAGLEDRYDDLVSRR